MWCQSGTGHTPWPTKESEFFRMNSIPQDATPQKRCKGPCNQILPSTTDYFYSLGRGCLDPLCKTCRCMRRKQQYAEAKQQPPPPRPIELICPKCETPYPATEEFFYPNPGGRYGLFAACIACCLKRTKRHRKEHVDEYHEQMKRYSQTHKFERAIYYLAHREDILETSKIRYQAKREDILEYRRQYCQTERGKIVGRTGALNRQARKKGAEGRFTASDIRTQYERQKGKCYWCGKKLGTGRRAYHVDHVIPLARGGSNWPDNLVIACPTCNLRRKARLPHEWPEGGRLF